MFFCQRTLSIGITWRINLNVFKKLLKKAYIFKIDNVLTILNTTFTPPGGRWRSERYLNIIHISGDHFHFHPALMVTISFNSIPKCFIKKMFYLPWRAGKEPVSVSPRIQNLWLGQALSIALIGRAPVFHVSRGDHPHRLNYFYIELLIP